MRSVLSHQPGLSPACDLLSNFAVLGLVHTLLNFRLFTGKVKICYIWISWYGSCGGTKMNQSKFIPWSSAVSGCPGWVGTPAPAEDCWDQLSLDLIVCTPVLSRIMNCAVLPFSLRFVRQHEEKEFACLSLLLPCSLCSYRVLTGCFGVGCYLCLSSTTSSSSRWWPTDGHGQPSSGYIADVSWETPNGGWDWRRVILISKW